MHRRGNDRKEEDRMKLTRQAEIAVQILALCARPKSNAPVTTRIAAAFAETTKDHAAQVVAKLSRAGYLSSERGRSGGIRLARPASQIGVGEILRLASPSLCMDGEAPVTGPFDMLRRAAASSYISTFDDFTIADLVGDPTSSRLRCLDCGLHAFFFRPRLPRGLPQPGRLPSGNADAPEAATFHTA